MTAARGGKAARGRQKAGEKKRNPGTPRAETPPRVCSLTLRCPVRSPGCVYSTTLPKPCPPPPPSRVLPPHCDDGYVVDHARLLRDPPPVRLVNELLRSRVRVVARRHDLHRLLVREELPHACGGTEELLSAVDQCRLILRSLTTNPSPSSDPHRQLLGLGTRPRVSSRTGTRPGRRSPQPGARRRLREEKRRGGKCRGRMSVWVR